MKAPRYTLRPQTTQTQPAARYAVRFELPEPRKGMIRGLLRDLAIVVATAALMIDN
jgi:hypothetical protein